MAETMLRRYELTRLSVEDLLKETKKLHEETASVLARLHYSRPDTLTSALNGYYERWLTVRCCRG